jgi:lipopolysaccharide/colanic/teichoic acid biosynthesis glycosyltransferase
MSMLGCAIAGLPMLLIAVLIKLDSPGPALFRQDRWGFNARKISVLKFRTMKVNACDDPAAPQAVRNDARVTRIGRILRKSSLDELPQLLNVLRGDMSFVGPRPERPHFVAQLEEKIPYYAQRHSVKPGITGWAQLCYPYGASEEDAIQKLQYDLYYVKNNSLLFDLAILVQTAEVIFMGKGAR